MNDLSHLLGNVVSKGHLAPEFDAGFYRATQADLAGFDDAALIEHYANHGRVEGRCASPAAFRVGFLAQITSDRPVLEIDPAVRPSLTGENVRYFDIADHSALIERAIREGYALDRCPARIDYISPIGDLDVISDTFDVVFSSHCIEHQPDLITHFCKVATRLNPGGRYYLIVPDKRYCFDHLLPTSTTQDVRQAYDERRTVHTFANVLEHYAMTTHNDTSRHWRGDHIDLSLVHRQAERVVVARDLYRQANGAYIDVHAWQFIPSSFREIVCDLRAEIPFKIDRIYETVYDCNEFGVVLCARPHV